MEKVVSKPTLTQVIVSLRKTLKQRELLLRHTRKNPLYDQEHDIACIQRAIEIVDEYSRKRRNDPAIGFEMTPTEELICKPLEQW